MRTFEFVFSLICILFITGVVIWSLVAKKTIVMLRYETFVISKSEKPFVFWAVVSGYFALDLLAILFFCCKLYIKD